MALYAKLDADLTVALDSNYRNILWKFTDDTLNTVIRTDLTVQSSGVAQVAATTTYALPMGKVVKGKVVLVKVDQECRVRLNGGTEYITVKPSGTYKGLLQLHGEITAISVQNQHATLATQVEYCIVGSES